MNQTEFNELHSRYVAAFKDYVTLAELSATILALCTPEPMPLTDRLNLILQECAENDAHSNYLGLKRVLHDAARLGYHCSN
jgi:hypothetical protein